MTDMKQETGSTNLSNPVTEQKFQGINQNCLFAGDLTEKQRALIVGYVIRAFSRVMDTDLLARHDPEASTWMHEDDYAKKIIGSNGNFCFYLSDTLQKMSQVSTLSQVISELDKPEDSREENVNQAIQQILMVNRVIDMSISTFDIGLIDTVHALRNPENNELEIKVKWCLTAASISKEDMGEDKRSENALHGQFFQGCPSGGAIKTLIEHSLGEEYKTLLKENYWSDYKEVMPDNLSNQPARPSRRKTVDEDTGREDGSPYVKTGRFNESVFEKKSEAMKVPIENRIRMKILSAT